MVEGFQTPDYVFAASWEVCNKVGGIYTVLSTQANTLQSKFHDRLFYIGPDLWKGKDNPLFEESDNLCAAWREYAVEKDGLLVRVGRWNVPGRPIVILVDFQPFFAKKNEISEIFTIGDRFVVAALNDITPAGYTPMKDLEAMLTMRVRNDKKAAIISEKLAAVTPAEMSAYAAAVNAASVDTAKFVTFSSPSISGLGYEPAVAGVAPSMEKGKISAPIKGNRGVYVLQVVNVNESAKPYDEAAEIARLDRQYTNLVNSRLMQVLRDKADIENTLIRFF